jgi:hypothetical protein
MHRWTAKLLLLVLLAPAFGPLALARASRQESPHCVRQAAKPAMQCHHGMAMAPERRSSETSFRALDNCCPNHDCCRGLRTSEWARPASDLLSCVSLLIEHAPASRGEVPPSTDVSQYDSARAPPRSSC